MLDIVSYGRGGKSLTPAQKELVARTVRRVPEVMVKVSGPKAAGEFELGERADAFLAQMPPAQSERRARIERMHARVRTR